MGIFRRQRGAARSAPDKSSPGPRWERARAPHAKTHLIVEKPVWFPNTGELIWRGDLALRLSGHAYVEAAILEAFDRSNWDWVIEDPIPSEPLGDATLARRHAILRLNQNQGETLVIQFGSLRGGLICWWPAEWGHNGRTIVPLV